MTRAAEKVNAKIAMYPRKVSTQWWFDHVATLEDLAWQVEMQDFMAARKDLVPSVSAQEQETYRRLQSQFSSVKENKLGQPLKSNGTRKGKGKEVYTNGGHDGMSEGRTWVGQKSGNKDEMDEEYQSLYAQE